MPHIRLEYTNNITIEFDFNDLFQEVHQVLNQVAGIKIENCKSRAICLTDFYAGNGEKQGSFVHLDVSFFEGRSTLVKKEVGEKLLGVLRKYFKVAFAAYKLQITIELHEIDRAMYFKTTSDNYHNQS